MGSRGPGLPIGLNFVCELIEELFINAQLPCQTFDQGFGWRDMGIALAPDYQA
jgi:hypothetical protein